ncbi:MAG TPA: SpoIIE family protein phosphatase [Solirubrobacteraceae bacterium]|jgi:serine phosphatase RsbU (regulator of sigma subunit)|nr:SpoIIE family protein phosphatase [Solirubrobacteraceae bacterium]
MAHRPRIHGEEWPRPGEGASAGDALSVLLVEDDDGDALIVDELLTDALPGVRIARSRTFAEALDQVDSGVDCMLLDLQLPDARGLDTVTRVRARAPQIPLIVLTGLNDEAAGVAAVDAGAQDYLVKGHVDGHQLARAIRYAIARRQAAEAQQQLRLAEAQAREVARLERGLAPRSLLSDPSVWIASRYRAGRNRALLGGDFLDVTETPDGGVRAVVGDVCGHGPDEAAVGVCLRAAWRALGVTGVDGERAMLALQRVLEGERETSLLYTTLCMLEIEPARDSARMLLAGHPPPMLIDGSAVRGVSRDGGGPPIGLGEAGWSPLRLELPPGWALLLYTDGIIEGRVDAGSERLGEDGLRRLIEAHMAAQPDWRERPEAMLAELIARAEALNGGELSDDVALLLIGSRTRGGEA